MKKYLAIAIGLVLLGTVAYAAVNCLSSGLRSSDAAILTTGGEFISILIVTDGSNAATATVYDNATGAAGKVIFKGTVPGSAQFGGGDVSVPVRVENGLYLDLSGTGASAIVYYR